VLAAANRKIAARSWPPKPRAWSSELTRFVVGHEVLEVRVAMHDPLEPEAVRSGG
jgi:hypothetical protein